jgi:RNA polymerase sigma-70 factor (ECF subfamily)
MDEEKKRVFYFVHSRVPDRFEARVLLALASPVAVPDLHPTDEARDLEAFHSGDRGTLERVYREHYARVARAAASVLTPADAETVTHEVFHRLLSTPKMRESFRGGDLGAWLSRVAKNQALDFRRRYARETPLEEGMADAPEAAGASEGAHGDSFSAAMVIERFRKTVLPSKWDAVFEARFLKQLGQREAAIALGMHRTTLMYQEHRIRALLQKFVLESER